MGLPADVAKDSLISYREDSCRGSASHGQSHRSPEIILFDEAISSLDAHTQVQIMDLLRELKDKLGLTYIFITHDLTSVTYLCDEVLFLYQGRVTEHLPVEKIGETADGYARRLLESIVVFDTEDDTEEAVI